jgi:hypothetical protein
VALICKLCATEDGDSPLIPLYISTLHLDLGYTKKAVDTFVMTCRISLHISPANGTEISTPLISAPKVGCRGLTEMWWKVGVSELTVMLSGWYRL